MDYDEFDPVEPHDMEYPEDDDEEFSLPGRRTRVTVSLSWQQIALILGVNAIISLIISLAVVIVAGSNLPSRLGTALPSTVPVPGSRGSPMAATEGATSQSQPPVSDAPVPPAGATVSAAQPVIGETPAREKAVEPTIYIVQPGDTLSNIARKFDVSLDDLMLANGLNDPDYVQVGQELLIPIGGLPPATPTFTPVPIPTDTPLPFNPPTPLPSGAAPPAEPAATVGPTPTPVPTLTSAPGSEIRLVLQVLDPGDLANEMVQIVNQGPFVRLTGWTLSDQEGNVYTFPDFSLWGGGAINIHTAGGSNTTTDLYWGQPNAVWNVGDVAALSDAEGTVIATYTVPGE
jgi:LysM repeat protein